jgi:hypothetical protein
MVVRLGKRKRGNHQSSNKVSYTCKYIHTSICNKLQGSKLPSPPDSENEGGFDDLEAGSSSSKSETAQKDPLPIFHPSNAAIPSTIEVREMKDANDIYRSSSFKLQVRLTLLTELKSEILIRLLRLMPFFLMFAQNSPSLKLWTNSL